MTAAVLYEDQISRGPLVLDTETLVGVIVTDSYVFSATHSVLGDIDDFEVSGVGYTRLSADARVELDVDRWVVWLDDVSTTDLSAVSNRGGIVWVRPGSDELVAFDADTGGAINPYEPTYPSGLYDYPVESIGSVLDDLAARIGVVEVELDYTPAVPADWDVVPATLAAALDELAARIRDLEGS